MVGLSKKLICYFGTTFAYGFYRGSTCDRLDYHNKDEKREDILVTDRCKNGIMVGIVYMNPILFPKYLLHLCNRIEIKVKDKDPSRYETSYKDLFSYNSKTI